MRINILGTGMTKFGELWDKSLLDLAVEAAEKAISESGLKRSQIDGVIVANMLYGKVSNQDHLGALITSELGLNCSSIRVEAACASGGVAVHQAIQYLESGNYENVLVIGAEKMTDVDTGIIARYLMGAAAEEETTAGLTFPGLYSLLAKAHMQKFGTTKEQLAEIAVKNHYHASLNPKAQFRFEISVEKVLKSSQIADPLTLLDCSPISDGAAAVVLSNKKKSKVVITGTAVASDHVGLFERKSLTELLATKIAATAAYKMAGIVPSDVQIAEVHDCFTIAELLAMEDLGFCKKGEGGNFVAKDGTKLGAKLVVNTSGGLKGCGHPVGATGVKQIIEVYEQLAGVVGSRQVKDARIGLTQNVGGSGATVAVHILEGALE